jgi:hypothetical protein
LGKALMSRLTSTIGEEGPAAAISVCRKTAPEIAQTISLEDNLVVGRTSLKYRNTDNAPDPWERSVLESFEKRLQQGEAVSSLEFSETVSVEGRRLYRFMKAIPTKGLCLTCHGTTIDPELRQLIAENYPEDQAVGFEAGDLRGAFSVSIKLNDR